MSIMGNRLTNGLGSPSVSIAARGGANPLRSSWLTVVAVVYSWVLHFWHERLAQRDWDEND